MRAGYQLLSRIPDPWRRWLTLRRGRRWLRAVRFEGRHNRTVAPNAPRISFYPMRLEPTAALAHVVARVGARITMFGATADLTVAWETGTWLPAWAQHRLPAGAVNRACRDISKGTVDRLWREVAGYSIALDPTLTQGLLVVKPIRNGVRGGRIVRGPLSGQRPDFVYQQLIDCRVDGRVHTLRPMLFGGRILVVYEKWRAQDDWFSGPEEVLVRSADELLSAAEQRRLVQFADAIGLDYGELDVVRDNGTGRIYVVDANRTPIRPRGLRAGDADAAFGPLADALVERIRRGGP